MVKNVKLFIERTDVVTLDNSTEAQVYELSDLGYTFSDKKQEIYVSYGSHNYVVRNFNTQVNDELTQLEANLIVKVIADLVVVVTANTPALPPLNIISNFISNFNTANGPSQGINTLSYTEHETLIPSNTLVPKFVSATITNNTDELNCSVWLSDTLFKLFYPDYNIRIVEPYNNFINDLLVPGNVIAGLGSFDLELLSDNMEAAKGVNPSTFSRILNVPYHVPGTSTVLDAYFGFIIYGYQGNYDYVLKETLTDYILDNTTLTIGQLEDLLPSLFEVNEFFVVPRWDNIAIPSGVGVVAINSQVSKAYEAPFDMNDFVTMYTDNNFMKNNSYNVPVAYNNTLLTVLNGLHSDAGIQDFRTVFDDILPVSSTSVDFSRMKQNTQLFTILIENFMLIADSDSETELQYNIISNTNYNFSLVVRGGVTFLSVKFGPHQYYIVPKYEYLNIVGP